jgi:hypothetical protein
MTIVASLQRVTSLIAAGKDGGRLRFGDPLEPIRDDRFQAPLVPLRDSLENGVSASLDLEVTHSSALEFVTAGHCMITVTAWETPGITDRCITGARTQAVQKFLEGV